MLSGRATVELVVGSGLTAAMTIATSSGWRGAVAGLRSPVLRRVALFAGGVTAAGAGASLLLAKDRPKPIMSRGAADERK